jgi:hypothetical protein
MPAASRLALLVRQASKGLMIRIEFPAGIILP